MRFASWELHGVAFRLRPGVEIVSAEADGDLIVSGDLDLSGHRYDSLNPHTQKTTVYGSGEVGSLVMRAGGDLDIYGSINDGFAPPPDTPDDNGWVLTPGYIAYGGDVVVPGPGMTLAAGTEFAAGKTLNYDLPIGATQFAAGTQLPVDAVLDASLSMPADTVLHAPIYDAGGNLLYAAGTILDQPVTLVADTRLGAGTVLPANTRLKSMVWPKGVALPDTLILASNLALQRGALIPSETLVRLPDDAISMPLRPANGDRQGANWAMAAMLPEGSQSWSMRVVAGADTEAADTRSVKAERLAAGSITLAINGEDSPVTTTKSGKVTSVRRDSTVALVTCGDQSADGNFCLQLSDGRAVRSRAVVVATGGPSAAQIPSRKGG